MNIEKYTYLAVLDCMNNILFEMLLMAFSFLMSRTTHLKQHQMHWFRLFFFHCSSTFMSRTTLNYMYNLSLGIYKYGEIRNFNMGKYT